MRLFRANSLVRNAAWMFVGNATSYVVQAAYFVYTARLLGVVQFGIYAGATALVSIASQYSTYGSGFLFLRYVSGDQRRFPAYWGNILFTTVVVGGGLVVLTRVFGSRVAGRDTAPLLICVAVSDCICGQLAQCCAQIFQTYERMRITAFLVLITNLLRLAVILGLYFYLSAISVHTWAVVQMWISIAAGVVSVAIVFWQFGRPTWEPGLFRRHFVEASAFALSGSTTSVYNDIDKTLLSHYGMNAANGVYSMAYRVINIACLPIRSIQSAAFPRLCSLGSNGVDHTTEYARKMLRHTLPISIALTGSLWVAAPAVPYFAGKTFSQSVGAIRWLCLLPVFRALHLSAGDALAGAGFQSYRLAVQFIAAVGNIALNLVLIPKYGWLGAAWSSLLTDGVLGALNWGALFIVRLNKGTSSGSRDSTANEELVA